MEKSKNSKNIQIFLDGRSTRHSFEFELVGLLTSKEQNCNVISIEKYDAKLSHLLSDLNFKSTHTCIISSDIK